MRAALVAVFVGVVVMLAPAASAKDAAPGFLDLPGIGALERMTDTKAPTSVSGTSGTTSQKVAKADGPAVAADWTDTATGAVTPDETGLIRSLPGGRHLPVIGVDAAASRRGGDGMVLALALVVIVLFTRFLFRLNTLGRTA